MESNTVFNGRFTETEEWSIAFHPHRIFVELDKRVHVIARSTILDMMNHRIDLVIVFYKG
jgi:hypothetical protein